MKTSTMTSTHDTPPTADLNLTEATQECTNAALMVVSTAEQVNIGDYIQAVAARQFLPQATVYIERERLDTYQGVPVNMIMNGYYMHEPEHWPPSSAINPLFVSIHINALAANTMLSEKSLAYFRQHQPIGCRDLQTRDLLQANGVEAYFSACLTLTLGQTFHNQERDGKVYIVDPCFNVANHTDLNGLRYLPAFLKHHKAVRRIATKYHTDKRPGLFDLLALTRFYVTYSRVFTPDTLLEATYISQQTLAYKTKLTTQDERMAEAQRLVEDYARASLVITSRIHCALPCLGLGTPVLFVNNGLQSLSSSCRMKGLIDLFNIVTWTGKILHNDLPGWNGRLMSRNNAPANKTDWQPYASKLTDRCRQWVRDLQPPHTNNLSSHESPLV